MNMSTARLRWLYLRGALWWIGLAFALVGIVIILITFSLWQNEKSFQERAVRAVATVTGKEKRLDKRLTKKGETLETVHLLVYTFQDPAGRQHQGKAGVSAQAWAQAKKGDALAIEYAGNDPAVSRPAGSAAPAWGWPILAGMGVLFASIGVGLVAYTVYWSGRRTRLVRDGVAALGVVGEVVEDNSAVKVAGKYRLTYQFTDGQGTTWEGRGPPQPWSLAARWDPGETILVLYDPRNPRRNEADVFETRQDDLARLQEEAEEDPK
jgi:hypothetical protein